MTGLFNMSPRLALNSVAYSRLPNTENSSKLRERIVSSAMHNTHLANAGCSHCCFAAHLASRSLMSALTSLFPHIAHVVDVGAKEQMIGTNAGAVIAVMANEQPVRNRTVVDFPRGTMGKHIPAIVVFGLPVSGLHDGTDPQPAVIGLMNLHPKAVSKGTLRLLVGHKARLTTKLAASWIKKFTMCNLKGAAALLTLDRGTIEAHQNLQFWCSALAVLYTVQGFVMPSIIAQRIHPFMQRGAAAAETAVVQEFEREAELFAREFDQ